MATGKVKPLAFTAVTRMGRGDSMLLACKATTTGPLGSIQWEPPRHHCQICSHLGMARHAITSARPDTLPPWHGQTHSHLGSPAAPVASNHIHPLQISPHYCLNPFYYPQNNLEPVIPIFILIGLIFSIFLIILLFFRNFVNILFILVIIFIILKLILVDNG